MAWMPLPLPWRKHVVDDGDDVGQALAGAGAGGQHVVVARCGRLDGFRLVRCRRSGLPAAVGLLEAEDGPALGVQRAAGDQVVDPGAGLEAGVQLDQRFGPEQAVAQLVARRTGGCASSRMVMKLSMYEA